MESEIPYAGFGYENAAATPQTEERDRSWLVLLHLSEFFGYFLPFAGFIAPVVIWLVMKEDWPEMDRQGRHAINWILSSTIYLIASVLLCLVLVGIPLLILLSILMIVFPIVGAVKASQGVEWKYPLSISFF